MGKETLILQLCNDYRKAVATETGTVLGSNCDRYRLLRNGILFSNLNYKEIQACCVGLTNVLLYKNLQTIIDWDHTWFWAWIAEFLVSERINFFTNNEMEIQQLFETIIRSSLAGCLSPIYSRQEQKKRINIQEQIIMEMQRNNIYDHNKEELMRLTHLVVAYLSFPFLEAVLKKYCTEYIGYSGKVRKPFQGKKRCYKRGEICSSLRDLFLLCHSKVANEELVSNLNMIFTCFKDISDDDPFDLIYKWRNSSLHGRTNYPTIGGTILNIAILISLDMIKDRYDLLREKIIQDVDSKMRMFYMSGFRICNSYYPPYT